MTSVSAAHPPPGGRGFGELRALFALGAPILLVQLGQLGLAAVDVAMVGRLTTADIAATALGNMFVWTMFMFGSGILTVLDAVVSHSIGAKDPARVRRDIQTGFALAACVALPLMLLTMLADPFYRLLRQPDEVRELAVGYAWWSIPGLLPMLLAHAARQSLQAMRSIRPIVIAVLATNLVNLCGNWVLIFGHLGAPALGVRGAAMSSSISRIAMLVILLRCAWPLLGPLLRPFDREHLRARELRRLFQLGLPLGLQFLLEYGAFSGSTVFLGWLGEDAMAAHNIAMILITASFMLPLSISMATAARVGFARGARDADAVARAAHAGLWSGAIVMAACALVFFTVPGALVSIFTDVEALAPLATSLVIVAAVFQVFDGVQVVCIGILRGLGDTRTAFLVNLLGFWIIGIPLGLFLAFERGAGAVGFWWGLVAGLATVALVLVWRVRVLLRRESAA